MVNMEEQALLRRIFDEPDDDLPRLVYADWLDEHGEPERAEFIRVQCELARMEESGEPCEIDPHEGHTCCQDPCPVCASVEKYDGLRRRASKLLTDDTREAWFAVPGLGVQLEGDESRIYWWIQPGGPRIEADLRRGFVSEVRLTAAAFLGGPCPDCDGHGTVRVRGGHGDWDTILCRRCNPIEHERIIGKRHPNAGHPPGCAGALGATMPVTDVVLTDREPYPCSRGEYGWFSARNFGNSPTFASDTNTLPNDLFDLLGTDGFVWPKDDGLVRYATREAALAALSRACVSYMRQAAGLSPLPISRLRDSRELTKI